MTDKKTTIIGILAGLAILLSLIALFKGGVQETITGNIIPLPGTTNQYTIELDSGSTRDNNYLDGTYQVRYANYALINRQGQIVQEGTWENVDRTYTKTITLTLPGNIADYSIVATITQIEGTFSNAAWTWSDETVLIKETLKLQALPPAPIPPAPRGWSSILAELGSAFLGTIFG